MPTTIRFTKATGAGNDVVLVDAMRGDPVADPGGLARAACDRHFGVGADGLILLEPSARADFRMRYFNADGSTGGMRGNGGRCAARLAHALGIAGSSVRFEALEHLYSAVVEEHWVRLRMKPATGLRRGIRIAAAGWSFEATFIDTGSPHAVLFTEDLESTDVTMFGRIIRPTTRRLHPAEQT